jgi:hypothetical protein
MILETKLKKKAVFVPSCLRNKDFPAEARAQAILFSFFDKCFQRDVEEIYIF